MYASVEEAEGVEGHHPGGVVNLFFSFGGQRVGIRRPEYYPLIDERKKKQKREREREERGVRGESDRESDTERERVTNRENREMEKERVIESDRESE